MPTEKEILEREIAKLTGAIAGSNNRNLSHGHPKTHLNINTRNAGHPYPYAASTSGRGHGHGRGRGRGRGVALQGNRTYRPGQSSSNTLVVNPSLEAGSTFSSAASASSAANLGSSSTPLGSTSSAFPSTSTSASAPASTSKVDANANANATNRPTPMEEEEGRSSWVNNTSRHGNKSLINPEVYLQQQKARLAHSSLLQTKAPLPTFKPITRRPRRKYDTQVDERGKRVVVIDGTVYEFEGDGKKLKRMDDASTTTTTSTSTSNVNVDSANADQTEPDIITPTRSSFSISGQQYVRTRAGNLVRRKSSGVGLNRKLDVNKNKKKAQPCRYFTKTGACQRASTCPYVHDPNKISVCSKYLRSTCPHSAETCPVSHAPNPHNAPSCVHFQRTGQCRNGKDCRYPHVKVSDTAPVCLDFSTIGWCDAGAACGERHAWECREYSETGKCKRGKKCELMHILRAKSVGVGVGSSQKEGEELAMQMDDGTALPVDLVEVLKKRPRQDPRAGTRPSSSEDEDEEGSDDDDDDDDDEEDEEEDGEVVDTEDEEEDVDVIAGQQDFIQFQRPQSDEEGVDHDME